MNWIEVNGTSLRYELSGSGKTTLVLVHEMGGSVRAPMCHVSRSWGTPSLEFWFQVTT